MLFPNFMTTHDELDDNHLLEGIRRGEQGALAALYARHSQAIYTLSYHVLHNRELAQEVTQDFFVAVWKQPHRWDAGKGQFAHWMMSVARHMAIDRLRHEQRRVPRNTVSYETIAHLLPQHPLTDREHAHLLRTLMHQLPKVQLRVILMAYFRGMSYDEIADALGVPHGTVKSRLRLGLQKLRALWSEATHDEGRRSGAVSTLARHETDRDG
jgi:RNA polymerase sigma-70 factor (ECF subfamily)